MKWADDAVTETKLHGSVCLCQIVKVRYGSALLYVAMLVGVNMIKGVSGYEVSKLVSHHLSKI